MTEHANIQEQVSQLRETVETSTRETNAALREVATEMHGMTTMLTQIVTENTYRDDALRRTDATIQDHETRIRTVEGSQEGNKVRWGVTVALGGAFLAFMTGVAVYIVRPLFVIMDHMQ